MTSYFPKWLHHFCSHCLLNISFPLYYFFPSYGMPLKEMLGFFILFFMSLYFSLHFPIYFSLHFSILCAYSSDWSSSWFFYFPADLIFHLTHFLNFNIKMFKFSLLKVLKFWSFIVFFSIVNLLFFLVFQQSPLLWVYSFLNILFQYVVLFWVLRCGLLLSMDSLLTYFIVKLSLLRLVCFCFYLLL